MAAKRVSFLVFVVAIWAVDFAESGNAPAPAVDCSSLILNMADCLSFVSNGSSVSKPEGSCCTGLKTVLKANGSCLCEAFKSSAQLGVVLNVTKAITLPAACKVSAPAATDCGLSETPAAAPVADMSPSSSPSGDDAMGAPSTSTAGTNDVAAASAPAPAPGSSASSSVTVSVGYFSVGLALVSFFSF